MLLSFVIPAHNEEFELPGAIASIRAAAASVPHGHEIVVADDASTDRTADIARAAGARVVQIEARQIAVARNAGAHAARGEVLFFVDADTRIAVEHVTGALGALASGDVGGGARIRLRDEVPLWAAIFVRVFCALYFAARLGAGAFLFTTAENFRAVGGFDEQYFAGEEVYFSWALKKLGRFTILRTPIVTSGRKLRMHSPWKIFGYALRVLVCGPRIVKSRKYLDLWYDGKREGAA